MRIGVLIGCISISLLTGACNKYPENPQEASLQINVSHRVNGEELALADSVYKNAAGNAYKASRLQYLLSDLCFLSDRGERIAVDTVLYVEAEGREQFRLKGVPAKRYLKMGFSLGLSPSRNRSGSLGGRKEFVEMAWPAQMGGGYHFMRFEGHFKDSSQWQGFSLHLGKDGNHIRYRDKVNLDLRKGKGHVRLRMDLNEWFEGKGGAYDLQSDPVYSMSNDTAMRRLSRNGASALTVVQGE